MTEPTFLTVGQVERLHEKLINRFGGTHGVRDVTLFEGAVIHPESSHRLYEAMIAIAEKRMDKQELAALLRELVSDG